MYHGLCVRWPHKCEKKKTFGKYIRVRCVRKYIWKYITLWCVRWLHMCLSKILRYIWYIYENILCSGLVPKMAAQPPENIKYLSTEHLYFLSNAHLCLLSTAQENSLTCQYVHKDLFFTIFCKMAADAQCLRLKNIFFLSWNRICIKASLIHSKATPRHPIPKTDWNEQSRPGAELWDFELCSKPFNSHFNLPPLEQPAHI